MTIIGAEFPSVDQLMDDLTDLTDYAHGLLTDEELDIHESVYRHALDKDRRFRRALDAYADKRTEVSWAMRPAAFEDELELEQLMEAVTDRAIVVRDSTFPLDGDE